MRGRDHELVTCRKGWRMRGREKETEKRCRETGLGKFQKQIIRNDSDLGINTGGSRGGRGDAVFIEYVYNWCYEGTPN